MRNVRFSFIYFSVISVQHARRKEYAKVLFLSISLSLSLSPFLYATGRLYLFSGSGVSREKSPINVPSVSKVRVIRVLGR